MTPEQDRFLNGPTPIERRGGIWLKRDDLFMVAGASGGKARSCWQLSQGAKGLTTAGSRYSPQINIVARIAHRLGVPCTAHTPEGALSFPVAEAKKFGAKIIQHKAGYNSVIIERARGDAKVNGWVEIPFGMECSEAVYQTSKQFVDIPKDVKRIVVPVGSGISLAGIVKGMSQSDRAPIPVLGIVVGANPRKRLARWLPFGHRSVVTLQESGSDYDDPAKLCEVEGVKVDPIYEAKCIPFLKPGDLFWLVGIRTSA